MEKIDAAALYAFEKRCAQAYVNGMRDDEELKQHMVREGYDPDAASDLDRYIANKMRVALRHGSSVSDRESVKAFCDGTDEAEARYYGILDGLREGLIEDAVDTTCMPSYAWQSANGCVTDDCTIDMPESAVCIWAKDRAMVEPVSDDIIRTARAIIDNAYSVQDAVNGYVFETAAARDMCRGMWVAGFAAILRASSCKA